MLRIFHTSFPFFKYMLHILIHYFCIFKNTFYLFKKNTFNFFIITFYVFFIKTFYVFLINTFHVSFINTFTYFLIQTVQYVKSISHMWPVTSEHGGKGDRGPVLISIYTKELRIDRAALTPLPPACVA